MFFLSLENQLFLIFSLFFSSYVFINAFLVKLQTTDQRSFGLSFALPFLLTIASFVTSPYSISSAMALMVLGHLMLVFLLTVILLIKSSSEALKLFYLLPFILTGAALFVANSSLYKAWIGGIYFIILFVTALNLALVIHSLFQKEKDRIPAYLGVFMIASSLGLTLLSGMPTLESLLLLVLGYGSCALYIYRITLGNFFREYVKNTASLHRMNSSIHTEVIRRVEEIERSNRKLLEMSKTDSMTGLYVKSAVLKSLEINLERSPQVTMSVLMFDIDKFKLINDSMGHQIGDRCIKTLSNLIQTSFRKDDILGRYGGDEFIVLLPSTPPVKAYIIADRFRQLVQSKSTPQITVSVGIANYPEDTKDPAHLVEAADKALYSSKQKGRNMVTLYSTLNK